MFVGSVVRGCGRREIGGIYLELGLSPYGLPIESFLFDPPNAAILEAGGGLHVPAIGVTMVEFAGVNHLFDHIGSEHYPNVSDWIEETARFGISRRLPLTLEYGKLTRDSRLFVIHSRAYVENVGDLRPYTCPTVKEHEHAAGETCIGACWQDLNPAGTTLLDAQTGRCEREMPSFHYSHMLDRPQVAVHRRPEDVTIRYKRAVFGKFPIGRLVVVGDPSDSDIKRRGKRVSEAQVPLDFVDD